MAALSRLASAQVIGIHAIHVPARDGRRADFGVQGELGIIVAAPYVYLWPSAALEYQWRDTLSPTRQRVAAELRILPKRDNAFLPYAGVSVSGNRSGSRLSEWAGTLVGFQGIVGVLASSSDKAPIALILEERFGYVREQNHATATHVGLVFSFW